MLICPSTGHLNNLVNVMVFARLHHCKVTVFLLVINKNLRRYFETYVNGPFFFRFSLLAVESADGSCQSQLSLYWLQNDDFLNSLFLLHLLIGFIV